MKVRDCMTKNVICVAPEETLAVAARLMARYNVGMLPVRRQDGSLCGILTDRDIAVRCVAAGKDAETQTVSSCMSGRIVSVSPDTDAAGAAAKMAAEQVRRLPVLQNGRMVGMVTLADLSSGGACEMEAAQALAEITSGIRRMDARRGRF